MKNIQGSNAYYIEPRSNDFYRYGRYPSDVIGKVFKQYYLNDATVHRVFVGQQDLTNDNDCGAHQVNYTRAIAMMRSLPNPTMVIARLQSTELHDRDLDNQKINIVSAIVESFNDSLDTVLTLPDLHVTLNQTIKAREAYLLENAISEFKVTEENGDDDHSSAAKAARPFSP